jgi:hypothetical protein
VVDEIENVPGIFWLAGCDDCQFIAKRSEALLYHHRIGYGLSTFHDEAFNAVRRVFVEKREHAGEPLGSPSRRCAKFPAPLLPKLQPHARERDNPTH